VAGIGQDQLRLHFGPNLLETGRPVARIERHGGLARLEDTQRRREERRVVPQ
jgi:hypothetical protein